MASLYDIVFAAPPPPEVLSELEAHLPEYRVEVVDRAIDRITVHTSPCELWRVVAALSADIDDRGLDPRISVQLVDMSS